MVAPNQPIAIPKEADEKATTVVVYTETFMFWGDVITKKPIRVSTWLRINTAPESLSVYNATVLYPGEAAQKPFGFPELHIPTMKVIAFHMMPPATDPLDYDPSEQNRRMEPVTALLAGFRMDGRVRIPAASTLKKYLEIGREVYTPLYDVTISHPGLSQWSLPKVSYVIVRQSAAAFGYRSV
jgi:hypothetical protein